MGIKTSELQRLTSVRETDSILVDANGMGTGRLPFADAAEFFRKELTKPGTEAGNVLTAALEAAAAAQSQAAQATQMAQETAAAAITPEQVDEEPTKGSENPVSSGGTFAALAAKQDKLQGLPGQVVGFDGMGVAYAVRGWSNLNLLDSWYFPGPINQRGVSGTISAKGYFIDRWKLVSGSVTLSGAGLVLNGTIVQILERSIGSETTPSALSTEGVMAAEYDDASRTFSITASGQTLVAAKLELGSVQTLAHQDEDGNWVLNDPPPNMVLELAKCQRYFYRQRGGRFRLSSCSPNTLYFQIPIPVMRTKPAITCSAADNNTDWIRTADSNTGLAKLSEFGVYCEDYNNGHSITLDFGKASHGISDAQLLIYGYIDFDANL